MRRHLRRSLASVAIDGAVDDSGEDLLGCVDPGEPEDNEQRFDWCVDIGMVMVCMAGPVAQEKYTGASDDRYAWQDIQNARAIIQQASPSLDNDAPLVKGLIAAARTHCRFMFDNHCFLWDQIKAVADELIMKGRLDKKQINMIMSKVVEARSLD